MELIDQHTKKIMENCKARAREAGLKFEDETLEYIVTNREMTRLSPKTFVPTLYDYWVNDVEVLHGEGEYKLYPNNPYESVINSRPAISFYNDNNPDWMNAAIFYHVLAHIDFFQNNRLFKKTWNDDFVGQALADKRLIAKLRGEKGRWVDYTIEFSRGIDNILGFYRELAEEEFPEEKALSEKLDFYFNSFLQGELKLLPHEFLKELERFNSIPDESLRESLFFSEVQTKHPEFAERFKKNLDKKKEKSKDLLEFLILNSPKLKKEENKWMIPIMHVVRNTGLYFAPQIRTKILNEGWASYWHDKLFRQDGLLNTHETDYAIFNSKATTMPRMGLNPYAIGKALFEYVEDLAEKGKMSLDFQRVQIIDARKYYDQKTGKGQEAIFKLRESFSDFTVINTFVDQDFVDTNHLLILGQRFNPQKGVVEVYVKSKKAKDYKSMLLESLYHPPDIKIDSEKTDDSLIYLSHQFEGKPLVKDYIANTMLGIEYLWGGKVQLETTELIEKEESFPPHFFAGIPADEDEPEWQRVRYTMENRKISREVL